MTYDICVSEPLPDDSGVRNVFLNIN
jgi:hypothetical protein